MTTKSALPGIARALLPHKHNPDTLIAVVRGLLGEFMGDDTLVVIVALALLALWTSVENNTLPDGTAIIEPPAPPPPGGAAPGLPPPPPTTTNAGDMIDPALVTIVNGPDFRGWSVSGRITGVALETDNTRVFSDGVVNAWPNVMPPGFAEPIQFTTWLFLFIDGQWVGSPFIEGIGGYKGSDGIGDHPFDYVNNWYYSSRWAPMTGHQIAAGETIGLMLTGGDARDGKGPYTGRRTQIVTLTIPESGVGSFSF